jgi:hypothetical protein
MHFLKTILPAVLLLNSFSLAAPPPDTDANVTYPYPYHHHHRLHNSDLDKFCREIKHLDRLIHELNATDIQKHHPHLNLTSLPALLANATAELNSLTKNATLDRLCKRALEVEHDCFPLVGPGWRWETANVTDDINGDWWANSTWANGTEIMLNATAIAEAKKNETLVIICETWVKGMSKNNLSETDAGKLSIPPVWIGGQQVWALLLTDV